MKEPKILIVDDEEKNIRLLRAMLTAEKYQIFEALSGEQALQSVIAVNPDLILLDVMMPGINGFDVCRKLKRADKTKMIPIVMVTALSEKKHRIEALDAGADDFLSKPVDRSELVVRVKSLLRMKGYHDELWARNRVIAEQNDQLRELEKIKEGLVHMIIHDLNNPLMSIIGNLDLIMLKGPPLSQDQLGSMTACLSHCAELKNMILSLLEIHKLEEGNLELDIENTDIADVIQEVMEQADFIAKQNQVMISANGTERPCIVDIDRNLIKRVLVNLLSNAIRHTPRTSTQPQLRRSSKMTSTTRRRCAAIAPSGRSSTPNRRCTFRTMTSTTSTARSLSRAPVTWQKAFSTWISRSSMAS